MLAREEQRGRVRMKDAGIGYQANAVMVIALVSIFGLAFGELILDELGDCGTEGGGWPPDQPGKVAAIIK